jgi:hypothetical protein
MTMDDQPETRQLELGAAPCAATGLPGFDIEKPPVELDALLRIRRGQVD